MTAGDRLVTMVTVAAPAKQVWRALRDVAALHRWHGWDYDGLDDEIRSIYHGDQVAEHSDAGVLDTGDGRFELAAAGAGTTVRLLRPRGDTHSDDAAIDEIDEGWTTFLHQLRFYLERHSGQNRHTVRADGGRSSGVTPLEHLGLESIRDVPAGEPYSAEVDSLPISGQVWFRSPHQTGLTVVEDGDSLVVISEDPATPTGGSVLVSTYGLDEASASAAGRRWTTAWQR